MAAALVKNTLLSRPFMQRIAALPKEEAASAALIEIVTHFEGMRAFASEIHTELHLVKPVLKVLGYAFESKPRFFEEQVKAPDFALFRSEEERVQSSPLWGTRSYYERVLAVLLVKRYGKNLEEGISGFYLEFENRIPLYQSIYLAKKAGVPWSILTNGKHWLLLRRPFAFEKSLIEIDLEEAVSGSGGEEALHLFYQIFSSSGLKGTLETLLEEERTEVIAFLREQRRRLAASAEGATREEIYARAIPLYRRLFPEGSLPRSEGLHRYGGQGPEGAPATAPVKGHDQCDVFTYLLTRGTGADADVEGLITDAVREERTKEHLLSLRILDMTPGFGAMATRLVESLAYLSFLLPYKVKRSFAAEWENEGLLHRFLLDHVVYGVERHPFSLDVLQNALRARFGFPGTHYRLGNPLLGISLRELFGLFDRKGRAGLLSEQSGDVMEQIKETHRLYSALSDRIKEDAVVKSQLEGRLTVYRQRMGEVMDLMTASYFDRLPEKQKIGELLDHLDGDEAVWEAARREGWFKGARETAGRKRFFHMEMEFPFLLNDRFDLIFIQPALTYLWEERVSAREVTTAYVKRAMTYLKQTGSVLLVGADPDELVSDMRKSTRYIAEARLGAVMVRRA
jgi:hypothetical protein